MSGALGSLLPTSPCHVTYVARQLYLHELLIMNNSNTPSFKTWRRCPNAHANFMSGRYSGRPARPTCFHLQICKASISTAHRI